VSDFTQMVSRAKKVRDTYAKHNQASGLKPWQAADYTAGMVGDVGDFVKLVMAKDGLRQKDEVDAKLQHEAADILWSLIVICDELKIDLAQSFESTMDELEARLS